MATLCIFFIVICYLVGRDTCWEVVLTKQGIESELHNGLKR